MERIVSMRPADADTLPGPANDKQDVLERLAAQAERGTDDPTSLTSYEIRQVCFALLLLLPEARR